MREYPAEVCIAMIKRFNEWRDIIFAAIFLVFMNPVIALAAGGTPSTLGGAIQYFESNFFIGFTGALVVFAFVGGVVMVISGVTNIAKAGTRSGPPFSHGIFLFFGGVLLTTLPVALGVDVMTFLDPSGSYYGYVGGGNNTVGQPQLCFSINGGGSSSFPITCILQNIATNVVPVAIETTFILCYVIALVVALNIIVGLARSRRSYNSEPPKHWHIKLFIAGLLANIPVFMGDVATSFGYNSIVDENGYQGMSGSSPSSLLAYNPPGGTSALTQYASTIQWGMVILSMFGVFYFIYGVLLMLNTEDRHHSRSMAWVHVVGGVMLANIGTTIKWMSNTFLGISI